MDKKECNYDEDIKTLYNFRDDALLFMGRKNQYNSNSKEVIGDLAGRLNRIESKVDKLIWGIVVLAVTIIMTFIR